MEFDEQSLRKGIQFGLGSQGIWTPELEDVMFKEIHHQALSQHDVITPFFCDSKDCNESKGTLCNGFCKGLADEPKK